VKFDRDQKMFEGFNTSILNHLNQQTRSAKKRKEMRERGKYLKHIYENLQCSSSLCFYQRNLCLR